MSPVTHCTIATSDLSELAHTRLKVACSLLIIDSLHVTTHQWVGEHGERFILMVADAHSTQGQKAMADAIRQKTRLLVLSDEPQTTAMYAQGTTFLSPSARVWEFADALRNLIVPACVHDKVNAWPPLLQALRMDLSPRDPVLMEHGLLRLVVHTRTGMAHMLRNLPLENFLSKAGHPRWYATTLSEQEWKNKYAGDAVARHSIESLWWRLAALHAVEIPLLADGKTRLAAWPELDLETANPLWLLPLSKLMHVACSMHDLMKLDVPEDIIGRVFTVVRASGLGENENGIFSETPRPPILERSFFKVAKRFGLKLLGFST